MTAIEAFSQWIVRHSNSYSEQALQAAKHAIEDALACLIAGSGDTSAASVRASLEQSVGNSTVFGGSTTCPSFAALANGTSAHALDYDDVFMPAGSHAGAVLLPALLALAEHEDRGGAQLIDAFIVGLQIQGALVEGLMPDHYDIGWHTTSTLGCVAAAAACARLLALDEEHTAQCLSIATSMAGGMKAQFGTLAKPLHAGLSAQHAVQAARLAQSGLQGSSQALDGKMGMGDLMGGQRTPDEQNAAWKRAVSYLNQAPLAIVEPGLFYKRFPCCGSNIRILDILLDLRQEFGFEPAQVQSIEAYVGQANAKNLMYHAPNNEFEGRFSLQYAVAVALTSNNVRLTDFIPGAVDRPEIRKLFGLTTMHALTPEQEADQPDLLKPHSVVLALKDGRQFTRKRLHGRGSAVNPLTEEDRRGKFEDCCRWVLGQDDIGLIRQTLQQLESLQSMRGLTRLIQYQAGSDQGQRFLRKTAA